MTQPGNQPGPKSFLQVIAAIFLGVLSIALVMNLITGHWYQNIKAEITSQPYARTITVDGEGKITATPDIGIVSLSVVTQGTNVKTITTEGNTKMNQVIDSVKNLGVDAKDITTSQYNLYPQYDYSNLRLPRITGYEFNQSVTVKIRDLGKINDVLDVGIKSGSNQVGQLSFDIDDPSAVKKQAREKAFTAAKNKAKEMADAAGVKLGRVVTFSEGYNYAPPMYANFKMDAAIPEAAAVGGAAVQPGSQEFNMTVSVTYEIE